MGLFEGKMSKFSIHSNSRMISISNGNYLTASQLRLHSRSMVLDYFQFLSIARELKGFICANESIILRFQMTTFSRAVQAPFLLHFIARKTTSTNLISKLALFLLQVCSEFLFCVKCDILI